MRCVVSFLLIEDMVVGSKDAEKFAVKIHWAATPGGRPRHGGNLKVAREKEAKRGKSYYSDSARRQRTSIMTWQLHRE